MNRMDPLNRWSAQRPASRRLVRRSKLGNTKAARPGDLWTLTLASRAARGTRFDADVEALLLPHSGSGKSVSIVDGVSEFESRGVDATVAELGEVVVVRSTNDFRVVAHRRRRDLRPHFARRRREYRNVA